MRMCHICEQYLCYVHSVVWIHNLHITLVINFYSNPPVNRKRIEGLWMRKSSGQQRWNASMPFITRHTHPNTRRDKNLGQLKKDLSTSNPWTNKYSIRPTQGRTNIQYVQHMDEKMHTSLNLSKRLVQNMDKETQNISTPKQSNIWTRQRWWWKTTSLKMWWRITIPSYFFKDELKLECFLIKITPMDEHELIFW